MKVRIEKIITDASRFIAIMQGIFISITMGYAIFNLYQSFNKEVTLNLLISQTVNFLLPMVVWKMLPVTIKALLKHLWITLQKEI